MSFFVLSAITFISAFLLFQIELIVAKLLLPNYGGSYLVWGACVVFFQAVLLVGYVFAHQLISKLGIKKYLKIHLLLLVLPILFFPGHALNIPPSDSNIPLVLDIFLKLLITIGPVFFVLSTISLVTQSWIASAHQFKGSPYVLYAISNLGSFLGLLSYPFFFELNYTNTQQATIWRVLYLILIVLNFIVFKLIQINDSKEKVKEKLTINWLEAFSWLALSSSGVILFLSVTNIITYEIAPAPLLWIFPLGIYLLTYVFNFKAKLLTPRWIDQFIFIIISVSVVVYFLSKMLIIPVALSTIVFLVLLFLLCMFIQYKLINLKPADGGLTFFYVMISLGGFIGGILTSWIIPLISLNLVEYLVGLLFLCLGIKRWGWSCLLIIVIIASGPVENLIKNHQSVAKIRNYYGIYDIFDSKGLRIFLHGTTLHGVELTEASRRWIPIGYYSPTSPLGEVLTKSIFNVRSIGGIGLGAGTIAMYSSDKITVDFYELDQDVIDLAKKHFGYLTLAPGKVNLYLGDARVSIKNRPEAMYDVLIVDAFGGDSIPIHLVNVDVSRLYQQHLNEGGVIMFHIPNRYFDMKPVLAHIAKELGAFVAYKSTGDEGLTMRTTWAMITWDQEKYVKFITQENWQPIEASQYPNFRLWSDDYSTILPVIRWDQVKSSFQTLHQIK